MLISFLWLAPACGGPPEVTPHSGPQVVPPPALSKAYTTHLGQLTGTSLNPLVPVGMTGTDLGVSFEREGELIFLFGDSWALDPAYQDDDSAAWTDPTSAAIDDGTMPQLNWFLDDAGSGRFLSLLVPPTSLKAMNVPVEGVMMGAKTYLFFAAGFSFEAARHTLSVLAHAEGTSFETLTLDHDVASSKFLNLSIVAAPEVVWIFGSGPYRRSSVFLAKTNPARLADRASWTYYVGHQSGLAVFGGAEAAAVPVVSADCVGELSVQKYSPLGYLMAYNCDAPRGIHLRMARAPAGPWSAATFIFDPDPARDRGYGFFMHQRTSAVGHDDDLSEVGREEEWGGEYGPYLLPQWFKTPSPGVHTIVYTLSSWNPYQVHLMKTVVTEPGATATPPPSRGEGLPPASLVNGDFTAGDLRGWQASGDSFAVFQGTDGRWRLTTYVVPKGADGVGRLWQDFTVDATTSELRFAVFGGDAAVREVEQTARGIVVRLADGRKLGVRILVGAEGGLGEGKA